MIDPRYIEKAANDPAVAAELEKNLSDIPAAENWLKSMCALRGMEVVACGVVIDKDGGMSSWGITQTANSKDDGKAVDGTKKAEQKTLVEFLTEYQETQSEKADEADGENRLARRRLIEMYFQDLAEGSGLSLFNWKA
jgi:alpha-tubulin suppressor-like RCC1 family protein